MNEFANKLACFRSALMRPKHNLTQMHAQPNLVQTQPSRQISQQFMTAGLLFDRTKGSSV